MRILVFTIFFLVSIVSMHSQEIIKSKVSFKIKNIGMYTKGKFSKAAIRGNFNIADLNNSSLNAVIEVNSIDTGIKKRDKHLLEAEYFDVAKFPSIQFTSTKFEKKSATLYILFGYIIIKNISKKVQLPLVIKLEGNLIFASSDFTLSRGEFGIGGKSWVLSDKVKAQVQFTVNKNE